MLKKIISYLPLVTVPFLICNYYRCVGLIHNAWDDGKAGSYFAGFTLLLLIFVAISFAVSWIAAESHEVYTANKMFPKYIIFLTPFFVTLANSIVLGICLSLKN